MHPPFLDTNIRIYSLGRDEKSETARRLIAEGFVISTQVLSEFCNVAIRKLKVPANDIETHLGDIERLAETIEIVTLEDVRKSLELMRRYLLAFYDGQILATALRAGCDTFYSEDLHHGLVVESRLTVINPFRPG
jgi:predicted nucleic acid-binding protein